MDVGEKFARQVVFRLGVVLPLLFRGLVAILCGANPALALGAQSIPYSQEPSELLWHEGQPLSWADFQGEPPSASLPNEAAKIWLGLKYSASWAVSFDFSRRQWIARLSNISTQAFVDRRRSWVLPNRRTPDLLRHEQGHFDLLEVFRRRLETEFSRLIGRTVAGSTPQEAEQQLALLLEEVYKRVWQAHEVCQAQYDQETRNGQDLLRQKQWENLIGQWLRELTRVLP
ncbi:MAG: hypothetical protein NZ651_01840 [Candidatus Bipolaricaulota bacterium]|nr:hypothetical protein [Candidatus Bipolaricaulota bacterium]MDW8126501.1 hypothetical protein [Candidatus Bipolaricaulota bacterium]